jgi:hypothetical protein
VAKKTNNFKKFGKLASLVKKLADKNPELKKQILEESESDSKNSWNKIQKWTSKNHFQKFKELPLKDFTLKNVENALSDSATKKKKEKCGNISNVTEAEILGIDLFDLENLLRTFDPNLQIQIDVNGGGGFVNTSIVKIKDLDVKSGEVNKQLRELVGSDSNKLLPLRGIKLRKQGKKQGDRSNCSYYIKFVFEDDADAIESQLSDSIVEDGVQYADLSPKQKEMRNRRLQKAEAEKSKRVKKAKNKKFDTPEKVVGKKEDTDIQKKIADKRDSSAERVKEIRNLISDLRKDVKDGFITKKFFQKEVAKLTKKLEKGGKI